MAKERIMVVEDESVVARDIQASLQRMGYETPASAASADEAIEKAEQHMPGLVLMDIMLKGKNDGINAAETIKNRLNIPVVYLTAYADEDTLKRAKVSEAFGYLLKPFQEKELGIAIEMALYKHKMENRLRESRQWLETVLRCLDEAVIATDSNAQIRFFNTAAEKLCDVSRDEVVGVQIEQVLRLDFPESMSMRDIVGTVIGQGQTISAGMEGRLVSRNGAEKTIEISASPIQDNQPQPLGMALVLRDITARKCAERKEHELKDKLARSQRIESVGLLAAGIAQELNNILGPIVGYPDLIMRNLPHDSPIREDLGIIKNSAGKAVAIIRDLLALGRMGHYPMEPTSLNEVIEASLHSSTFLMLKEQNPLVIMEMRLGLNVPQILGSARHLMQMVINLLMNAFDSVSGRGRVDMLTVQKELPDRLEGNFEPIPPGLYAALEVIDSGPSISVEEATRMFEPFQVKRRPSFPGGSSFGMAVVYGMTKDHKGFVDFASSPEKGNRFTLYFPATEHQLDKLGPEHDEIKGHETILVVDDDPDQRRFVVRSLENLGYTVQTAHNGRYAVERLADSLNPGKTTIALVLIDMIMADDYDGLETYKDMSQLNPGQKAIVVSGFSMTERIKEVLRLGVGQFIQKPFSFEELGKAIRRELDKPAEQ